MLKNAYLKLKYKTWSAEARGIVAVLLILGVLGLLVWILSRGG